MVDNLFRASGPIFNVGRSEGTFFFYFFFFFFFFFFLLATGTAQTEGFLSYADGNVARMLRIGPQGPRCHDLHVSVPMCALVRGVPLRQGDGRQTPAGSS